MKTNLQACGCPAPSPPGISMALLAGTGLGPLGRFSEATQSLRQQPSLYLPLRRKKPLEPGPPPHPGVTVPHGSSPARVTQNPPGHSSNPPASPPNPSSLGSFRVGPIPPGEGSRLPPDSRAQRARPGRPPPGSPEAAGIRGGSRGGGRPRTPSPPGPGSSYTQWPTSCAHSRHPSVTRPRGQRAGAQAAPRRPACWTRREPAAHLRLPGGRGALSPCGPGP